MASTEVIHSTAICSDEGVSNGMRLSVLCTIRITPFVRFRLLPATVCASSDCGLYIGFALRGSELKAI